MHDPGPCLDALRKLAIVIGLAGQARAQVGSQRCLQPGGWVGIACLYDPEPRWVPRTLAIMEGLAEQMRAQGEGHPCNDGDDPVSRCKGFHCIMQALGKA